MPALRMSVVQYLNTAPLIWGMLRGEQQGRYQLELATPAGCAEAVRQRRADVGIIPTIEYPRLERLRIIPGISIASKLQVRSILLLSKVPMAGIRTIAVDDSSRTSAALLRILMHKFHSRPFQALPSAPKPDEMLQRADAALVIGDPALTCDSSGLEVYDLAAEWRKFTGLPFVFAFWAGHEDVDLARHVRDFENSKRFGLARVDEIAAEYAPKLRLEPEALKVYLTKNIDYSLDEENQQGLRLFYKLAHEQGLIPAEKVLSFV